MNKKSLICFLAPVRLAERKREERGKAVHGRRLWEGHVGCVGIIYGGGRNRKDLGGVTTSRKEASEIEVESFNSITFQGFHILAGLNMCSRVTRG